MAKTICLDFDGVCNTYDGWKGENDLFTPRPGLAEFLLSLKSNGFTVVIHSTRPAEKIREWLQKFGVAGVDQVTHRKPPAICYLDDRAVLFSGSFEDVLPTILDFRAHWEKELPVLGAKWEL